uniref:Uncharacterized protein n=1 Tax=Panagrolaimus sp. ES5 TaxID=591445 RepID=A0AC34F3B3_9BILA
MAVNVNNSDSYSNKTEMIKFDYYVCGVYNNQKSTVPECKCFLNYVSCEAKSVLSPQSHSEYYDDEDNYIHIAFKSFNIQILDKEFVVKNVTFEYNEVPIIKKTKILNENAKTVENLSLRDNQIAEIENETFDKFASLKILKLGRNKLTNISDAIFTEQLGKTLIELDLNSNLFHSIADINFVHLQNLEILWLYNNHFNVNENITSVFPAALSNLKLLNLDECNITALNENIFASLTSLETLHLFDNPLQSFPAAINILAHLQYLNLESTDIVDLSITVKLKINPNFEKLILSESRIKVINDCAFCSFPNLKILHLWKNRHLSHIHENAFGYAYNGTVPKLESFSVEFCKLPTIPEKLLNWKNVQEIAIEGNPFICNCSMAWIINDLASASETTLNFKEIAPSEYHGRRKNEMKCAGPHALRDTAFIHLSGKFCINNKKEQPSTITVTEAEEQEDDDSDSSTNYLLISFAIIASFALGFVAFPLFRYLFRLRKQNALFFYKNENDEKIMEDFDGTNTSNV